ncbi:hypothetical protein PRUPE_5G072200 [Prunus persica]|uniref:Uncharacterized protein n=1 Tax=Prunus persica TaxID=3760 RepID=A0A251P509_PRUPE|nr:hypothetical protein PRUPE_5G072200 [Prunus persica]
MISFWPFSSLLWIKWNFYRWVVVNSFNMLLGKLMDPLTICYIPCLIQEELILSLSDSGRNMVEMLIRRLKMLAVLGRNMVDMLISENLDVLLILS